MSVIGGSLCGPASQLLETKSSLLKTQYSMLMRICYSLILAVFEACLSK